LLSLAFAQPANPAIRYVTTAPTGPCIVGANPAYYITVLHSCTGRPAQEQLLGELELGQLSMVEEVEVMELVKL
jgi:hypothetical protein